MRRFVVIGRKATASPDFSLVDIAGTSGRLDVLLRCLRSALLVSHGLRRDTVVYLVLLGGELAPRILRVDGSLVRFVRPDERMLAILVQKALARTPVDSEPGVFVEVRAGLAVARGGLDAVLADLASAPNGAALYVLEESARDVRELSLAGEDGRDGRDGRDVVVFVGDHEGFDEQVRARLAALGAVAVGVGPVSLHADDAITVLCNELDRTRAATESASS